MIELEQMPANARVWVYASDTKLTDTTVDSIKIDAEQFVNEWTSHQNKMNAQVHVLYNTFIVFVLDESINTISGCGIDKSVHFVKKMEEEHKLNFFNRLKVQIFIDEKNVLSYSKNELQALINKEKINEHTLSFNNSITNKKEFDSSWIIPLQKLWIYNSIKPYKLINTKETISRFDTLKTSTQNINGRK